MNGFRRIVRTRRALIAGAVAVVVVGVAAGFALTSGGDDAKAAVATTSTTSSSTTSTAVKPKPKPRGVIAPLTGLRDVSSGAAHRPALTIKVENTPQARPQIGLEAADIVYEEVVESDITRLLAIYQSHVPAVVGPVRSVRRTDAAVVAPIGGIFAFSGGARYAVDSIRTAPVTLVDETSAGAAMFRDRSRSSPHNLFGRPAALFAFGGKPVPPPPLFSYTRKRVKGTAVTQVGVGFGNGYAVSYDWNKKQKSFDRSIFGRADIGAAGVRQSPRNVVVLLVNYAGGAGVIGAEAELVGQGNAVVFTGGRRINAQWVRSDRAQAIRLRDASGDIVRLTPGQTWVELAPIGTPVAAS